MMRFKWVFNSVAILIFTRCALPGFEAGKPHDIAYTDRGARGEVWGNLNSTQERAEEVFKRMGIQLSSTSVEQSGHQQNLEGKIGAEQVNVQMVDEGNSLTRVEVTARAKPSKWNKNLATQVLSQIVQPG